MRNQFKLQAILSIVLFILLQLNITAQNELPLIESSRNYEEYDNSEDVLPENLKQAINKEYFKNRIDKYPIDSHSSIITSLSTTDLIDSVVYVNDGIEYKEYYTYDSENKRLISLKIKKPISNTNWENDFRYTSTYDDNNTLITYLKEKWNGNWINYRLSTYTRDGAGNTLTNLYQKWDSSVGIWINSSSGIYTYDGNGNRLTSLTKHWDSNTGVWTNYWSATYTYDGIGNLLTFSDKDWNSSKGIWINHWRRIYTYDSGGNLLTFLAETWENIAGIWEPTGLTTYTYNDSGNLLTDLSEKWDSDAEIWVNNDRETYTYNNSENMLSDFSEKWNVDSSKWVNDKRYTYTYDNSGNILTDFFEDWRNNTYWKKGPLTTHTYDDNDNLLLSVTEYWNIDDEIWWESLRRYYTYNSNGNLIHSKSEAWSEAGWGAFSQVIVINNNSYNYEFVYEELNAYYSSVTSVDNSGANEINSFSLSQNYPNPFNPSTTISYSLPQSGFTQLKVYDMLGREVAKLVNKEQAAGNYNVVFDASQLSSGIYFYHLRAGQNFVQSKKMVLLR